MDAASAPDEPADSSRDVPHASNAKIMTNANAKPRAFLMMYPLAIKSVEPIVVECPNATSTHRQKDVAAHFLNWPKMVSSYVFVISPNL